MREKHRAGLLHLIILISLCFTALYFLAALLGTTVPMRTLIIVGLWLVVLLQSLRWLPRGKLGRVELTLTAAFLS